nr:PREDICTED: ATP-binding cassette sub-family C member Sur [Bemisia tabaci]
MWRKLSRLHHSNTCAALCCLSLIILLCDLGDCILGHGNVLIFLTAITAWIVAQCLYALLEVSSYRKILHGISACLWFLCSLVRLFSLITILSSQGFSLNRVNMFVCITLVIIFSVLSLLDISAYITEAEFPSKKSNPDEHISYRYNFANWWSKLSFYWLMPLLIKGFKEPLELEDLGQLPEEERIQYQFKRFTNVYYSLKSTYTTHKFLLWKCFVKLYSRSFVYGGILKLVGDAAGLIGPLGMAGILKYIEDIGKSSQIPSEKANIKQQVMSLTFSEFLRNGYVMAIIVLLSAIAQGSLSQASTHILNTEGIHLKNSLQAFIYYKILRSRKIADNDSDFEKNQGNITNLVSEDCYNIMSCYWIGNYVWAIPVKIFVLITLLYYEIGFSAIIGALCCILIVIPLQFLIGRNMSSNSKLIMEASDKRMKEINESLQGIKLLKLRGWEDKFYEKISISRDAELNYLNKDSLYWALMTFLTHASSVLIALLTFGIYSLIETVPLMPSNVFAGLALFNQLTVPLFIFPITVPIIINAINSVRRIEEFLSLPEVISSHKKRGDGVNDVFETLDAMNFSQTKVIINGESTEILANILEINEDGDDDFLTRVRSGNSLSNSDRTHVNSAMDLETLKHPYLKQIPYLQNIRESNESIDKISNSSLSESTTSLHSHEIPHKTHEIQNTENQAKMRTTSTEVQKDTSVIFVQNAEFSWGDSSKATLYVKDLVIPKGQLTVILGNIGSGKTSLLAALLGEMECTSGCIQWQAGLSVAYVSQKPWLLNATLRDNILFGRRYRHHRFQKVIASCALQPDIENMPAKDLTLLGENGVSLSGGQQQRIAIARAIYSRAQVIIMDDPLSALDHKMAKYIFERSIKKLSIHHNRTVILVTHSLHLLPTIYHYIIMEDNRVAICGKKSDVHNFKNQVINSEALLNKGSRKRTATERWHLLKLISKLSFHQRQTISISNICQSSSSMSSRQFVPFRKRLGTFSGSRYFAHDLLLPTDECNEDDKTEWMDFKKWRDSIMSSNHHKVISRCTSLQADQFNQCSLVLRQSSSSNIQPIALRPRVNTYGSSFGHGSLRRKILRKHFAFNQSKGLGKTAFGENNNHSLLQRAPSAASEWSEDFSEEDDTNNFHDDSSSWNKTPTSDSRSYGEISHEIYWTYVKACGLSISVLFLIITVIWQALKVYTDFWLSYYSEDNSEQAWSYLSAYAFHSIGCVVLSFASIGLGQYGGAVARKKLHNELLFNLLHCHVYFFEVTPLGRIISRFSNDIVILDKKLATSVQRLLQFLLLCFSAIVVNCIVSPWFLVVAVPICMVYHFIQKFYRRSSRELQRLESITRSPIISHLVETVRGVDTIRAYGQENYFIAAFFHKLNIYTNAFIIHNAANRWLGLVLDYLGAVIVFTAMIMSLISASFFPKIVSSSLVGLAINYTLLAPIYLNWVVKFLADMEMNMAAIERILEFASEQPENYKSKKAQISRLWPSKGDINFENVTIFHPENDQPTIKSLNLHIHAGQKVGVCGRSGSGKTSLIMSLFRMANIKEGRILIDDEDISEIPLKQLRSKLAVIPQDVLMFSGSIRENLDLLNQYTDEQIWRALEMAQLSDFVQQLPSKLDSLVKEGGFNFSIGQKQLFCLARAILQDSVCLIMDEATSSLSPAIEPKLLASAEEAFANRTVLSVTHHLSSVMSYDRIIVMDCGSIVEEGSPSQLLSRPLGFFSSMLRASQQNTSSEFEDIKSFQNSIPN